MTTAPLSYAQLDSTNWGWVKYSRVDFGSAGANKLVMRASGSRSEPLLKLSLAPDWTAPALAWADMVHHDAAESRVYTFPLLQRVTGEHDVYLRCRTCTPADTGVIDWLLLARDTTVAFRERLNIAYPALHWPVAARSHHLVVWDSLDLDPPLVDIDYASDTGRTWTSVARAIPNAGCYLWAAPDSPVGGCRIGVRATGSSEPMDVCHGLFDVVDSTRNPCEREIQLHTADNIYGGTRDRARWIGSLLRMNSAAWFQYSQVDFGSAGPHEAALTVNVSSLDSIALSFHIDMPDGPCVLACTLSSSQPDTLHHYTTFSYACAPGLSGVHDLYVRCPSCPITRVSTFLGGLKVCPAVAVSKPRTAERRTVQVVQQGDMLRISLAGAGPTSAAIFTLDGRLLWSRTSPSGANRAADGVWTVDCRRIGLPRGCYALRVESGPQRVVRVLTVSR